MDDYGGTHSTQAYICINGVRLDQFGHEVLYTCIKNIVKNSNYILEGEKYSWIIHGTI